MRVGAATAAMVALASTTVLVHPDRAARRRTCWPGSRARSARSATGWILVSQVFPVILIIIPLFLILRTIGLIGHACSG